jgi:hypothetical protein
MALVKKNPPKGALRQISRLAPAEQLKAENEYNAKCLAYAHLNLDM